MKTRLLVVLFAVLSSCQPIAPGPARYSCSRELPPESQCIDGWRCGLDGFCFDPSGANVVTLACQDPLTDCPTDWKCGLEGRCFDPANPGSASLPCGDPQRDCPTTWKCGLDARCLDPALPGLWRCEDTARDCTGGWTCGALGLCFDRADAGRVACRAELATDCNDGWRCGIDGLCQQRDAGAPWPCRDDSHCEASWRCSPGGACLDPSLDALRPNDGAPLGARFDLGWGPGVPDEVVLDAEPFTHLVCGSQPSVLAWTGAARLGQRVELFAVSVGGTRGLPTACDGGAPSGAVPIIRGSIDFSTEVPRSLAQLGNMTMVLGDGGVHRYQLEANGQVVERAFSVGNFKRLRAHRRPRGVIAFSDGEVWLLPSQGPGGRLNGLPMTAPDGGIGVIFDALIMRVGGEELAFAATDQGLFARSLSASSGSLPWTLAASTSPSVNFLELRIAPAADGGQPALVALVEGPTADPAAALSRLWTFHLDATGAPAPTQPTVTTGNPYTVSSRAIPSLTGSYTLRWAESSAFCPGRTRSWVMGAEAVGSNTNELALVRCELGDGGLELHRVLRAPFPDLKDIAPDDEVPPLTRHALWSSNNESDVVMVDPTGAVSVASTAGTALSLQPWVPSAAPDVLTGRVDDFVVGRTGPRELTLGGSRSLAFVRPTHFISGPDAGLLRVGDRLNSNDHVFRLVAGVESRSELSVIELTSSQGVAAVLVEADDAGAIGAERTEPLRALARAQVVATPQFSSVSTGVGTGLWLVSAGDQLHVAPLGLPALVDTAAFNQFPDLVSLPLARFAITPLPGALITHVLGLPADAAMGANSGQALVVAAGRLFHVRAENPVVWRSTEPLGTSAEIISSWADGARVRSGDREGRVTSFPSRVVVSAPLAGNARAWDYVDVCGVTYALATNGLWRLAARAGEPIGAWAQVPLPGGLSFTAQSTLYTDGTALLVFDSRGRATNVTALTCAQPL